MKYKRLWFCLVLAALFFSACSKNRFKFDEFQGVQADGEMLLPIASGHYSMMDLMERFQMDSLVECDPSGNMSYNCYFEQLGVINGEDLLHFDDMSREEHYSYLNPLPGFVFPQPIDTVFTVAQALGFESDYIHVLSGTMKSGRFDFNFSCNFAEIQKIEISSPVIKDANGNGFVFVYDPNLGNTGFDLAGLRYESGVFNGLTFNYVIYGTIQNLTMPEFTLDVSVAGSDFGLSEMNGYVDSYNTRNRIDSVFNIFPGNMSGTLEVENVLVTLSERNTFGIDALLIVDSAMIWGDDFEPSFLVSPLPLEIEAEPSMVYKEVFQQPLDGSLSAREGNVLITSDFIVNPDGMADLVTVTDASTIDMKVNVNVPFVFNLDDVRYLDTVNLRLSEIQSPEWIEKLTLELSFTSTIPFNLVGKFMMYDSEHDVITDVLLNDATLIEASYDGQPTKASVSIEIDDERLEKVMQSDRIILDFGLDSDGRDIELKADQNLQFYVKAKVKYDGIVELNND